MLSDTLTLGVKDKAEIQQRRPGLKMWMQPSRRAVKLAQLDSISSRLNVNLRVGRKQSVSRN